MTETVHELLQRVTDKVKPLGPQRVAIRAERVFTAAPFSNQLLHKQVVIVEDGIIQAMVAWDRYAPSPEEEVIEVDGSTLLPGLIEAHCHVTGEWVDDPHTTHLESFPETRVLRGLLDAWAVLDAGFTTLFSMGHGHPNYVAAIKTMVDKEGLPGPRIYHCGWALSQTAGHGHIRDWNYELVRMLKPRSTFADGPDQLRTLVRENVGTGADFIKLYAGEGGYTAPGHISRRLNFTPEEIRAITDEAHRMGFRVAAHCMTLAHVRHAVENGVDRIEHGPVTYEQDFVPLLKEYNSAWCPTLSQLYWGLREKDKRKFSPEMVSHIEQALEARCRMIQEALDARVVVGFGTDNRMRPKAGKNCIEFKLMVEHGITACDALTVGTLSAARLVGLERQLGSIEVGKLADFILVDGNPLDDISLLTDPKNVSRVFRSYRAAHPVPAESSP